MAARPVRMAARVLRAGLFVASAAGVALALRQGQAAPTLAAVATISLLALGWSHSASKRRSSGCCGTVLT